MTRPAFKPEASEPMLSEQTVLTGPSSLSSVQDRTDNSARFSVAAPSAEKQSSGDGQARRVEQDMASKPTSGRRRFPLVLRVLSGVQQGAQAGMRHHRLLVGNLESECDVVLDVGRPDKHACLVRASKDGWTVLCVAGDLWVGQAWVAPQQTCALASGDVLTLGEVSFCIADAATIDWSQVCVPEQKEPSRAAGKSMPAERQALRSGSKSGGSSDAKSSSWLELIKQRFGSAKRIRGADVAHAGTSPKRTSGGWRVFIGALSVAAVMLAGLGAYLFSVSSRAPSQAVAESNAFESARAVLAGLPWANELTLQPDPHRASRVLLGGYLPKREKVAALDAALRRHGIESEHRWTAIDELSTDLSRRLALPDAEPASHQLRYSGQGRFALSDARSRFDVLDPLLRRALQDMPAVRAIELRLADLPTERAGGQASEKDAGEGAPIVVRYARAEGGPGGLLVTGLERLQPVQKLQHYEVHELRPGELPSIVLDNGARYFEGSELPGGALLLGIHPSHLVVQIGTETRRIKLEETLSGVAAQPAARSPRSPKPGWASEQIVGLGKGVTSP